MKREKLQVEKRDVLGKKVKSLRKQGLIPGNVYGKDFQSASVQLPLETFMTVFNVVHETGLVDLAYDGQTIPVLIHNVQVDPRTHTPLHADFFKVNLRQKVSANIPLVAVGEPLALADKKGILVNPLSELEIEALPADLPEKIEVNIEGLAEVGDQILVENLTVPNDVTVVTDPAQLVFRIDELPPEEPEEAPAEEVGAEGEVAAEGEKTGEGEETGKEEKTDDSAKEDKKDS
jgi:large subunit ribosomal protein L25